MSIYIYINAYCVTLVYYQYSTFIIYGHVFLDRENERKLNRKFYATTEEYYTEFLESIKVPSYIFSVYRRFRFV